MSRTANISRADLMLKGRAYAQNAPVAGSKPGMHFAHVMVIRWGAGSPQGYPAPAAAVANNVCASQTILSATTALINGALAVGGIAFTDVPRSLQLVSSNAGDTTQTATIVALDTVGRRTTERVTMNGTTPVLTLRAYTQVLSITFSAALAGNLTVGTGTKLGLPVRIRVGDIIAFKANEAAIEAGTIVAGVTTAPTITSGDPMGTIIPTTAANGTNIYTAWVQVEDDTENAYGLTFNP